MQTVQIKPMSAGQKAISWKGHEQVVLCCDWSISNNTIITGAEDCKYKIWDHFGRMLYCSQTLEHVINCIKWSPSGDNFVVGSFQMLRLCDSVGWTHSFERPQGAAVIDVDFSSDSTQIAMALGDGSISFGAIVNRSLQSAQLEVILEEENKLRVSEVVHELSEELEFKERVISMSLGHG